jgi:hypothetical protein
MEYIVNNSEQGSINGLLPRGLTKTALVRYMRSCPVVLSARKLLPDRFDPNAKRISLSYSSDGVFIWSAETREYIERYAMSVPENFLRHVAEYVAAHGEEPPQVQTELLHEATEALRSGRFR